VDRWSDEQRQSTHRPDQPNHSAARAEDGPPLGYRRWSVVRGCSRPSGWLRGRLTATVTTASVSRSTIPTPHVTPLRMPVCASSRKLVQPAERRRSDVVERRGRKLRCCRIRFDRVVRSLMSSSGLGTPPATGSRYCAFRWSSGRVATPRTPHAVLERLSHPFAILCSWTSNW
jgi:hypothetical protein